MTQPRDFPDLVPDLIDEVQSLLSSTTVAVDLKGWHAPEKWVTLQSTGGTIGGRVASPRFDVSVYAPAKPAAFTLAMQVIDILYTLKNMVFDDYVVTDVVCTWPADISDPINSNPRFVFDSTISIRRRP